MKKILVVNGEKYWQDFLPEFEVTQKSIQNTSWVLKENKLFVFDKESVIQPDGILWRVGAIKPTETQTTALNLIELSQVPCVNSAKTLKIGFDRLSMLYTMKNLDLPIISFNVITKSTFLENIKMKFPFVVKVGNYHGGFGKVLIKDENKWQDIKDLLFVTDDYVTTEPFIDYLRDIRYIIIKDKIWAMSRRGKYWKANIETINYQEIEPKEDLVKILKKLQNQIGADILAIDLLEEETGKIHILEYNDIPGLSGFTDELKYELAKTLKQKLKD